MSGFRLFLKTGIDLLRKRLARNRNEQAETWSKGGIYHKKCAGGLLPLSTPNAYSQCRFCSVQAFAPVHELLIKKYWPPEVQAEVSAPARIPLRACGGYTHQSFSETNSWGMGLILKPWILR